MRIKPITLEIEQDLWIEFKDKLNKNITINHKIETLIEEFVNGP